MAFSFFKESIRRRTILRAGLIISLAFSVSASAFSFGKINKLEEITLGGVKQWIQVTGHNKNNPILLILHGGPGYAMLPLFHTYNQDLEKKFTVINWDQRGAGKSFSDQISPQTMTLEQLVADAHELTQKLKAEFKQEKIYILGHSFGTMLGVILAAKYPEDYYAYIGVGQVVNVAKNEMGSYTHVLQHAIETEDKMAMDELTAVGAPDIQGNYLNEKGYDITSKWVEKYGAELHHQTNLNALQNLFLQSDAYKNDQNKLLKGHLFSQILFKDQAVWNFDAESQATVLKIPVYIFAGKYDHDTPIELAKEYYQLLQAPKKSFIEFKESAHFPFYEEPHEFNAVMIDKVLVETKPTLYFFG